MNQFTFRKLTCRLKYIVLLSVLLLSFGTGYSQEEVVSIPEPLNFDLVRGLGAKKGELEINTLAEFPLNNGNVRGVDWAPEIEYALFNGFAIELEFPLNDFDIEAYKFAFQWTIGSSENNKFIHGIQMIGESYIHDDLVEYNFMYVPAYRFNEVWSTIGLFGVMLESGANAATKNSTILLNASLFANINEHTVVGLEINNTNTAFQKIDDNHMELLILPQAHYEFESGLAFQLGMGGRFHHDQVDASGVLRVIKTF